MRFAKENYYSKKFDFSNGYGLSVICKYKENGLFEAALLNEHGEVIFDDNLGFEDVVENLDFEDVAKLIKKVSSLPAS
jgi:hypothetical protein